MTEEKADYITEAQDALVMQTSHWKWALCDFHDCNHWMLRTPEGLVCPTEGMQRLLDYFEPEEPQDE